MQGVLNIMDDRGLTNRNKNYLDLRSRVLGRLCQAFQFQLLPDGQKVVQAVLLHLHLPVVDEVHHWYQIWPLRRDDMKIQKKSGLNLVTPSVPSEAMVGDGHWPKDLGKMCWTLTESPEKKICYKILWNNLCWQWETSRSMFKQMYHWYCTYLMRSYLLTILASKSHIRELPCSSNLRWTGLFWSISSRCILWSTSL